jgi:hypothetical protein
MAVTWITPAGSLAVIAERVIQDIPLSATSPEGTIRYSLIAGKLPRGLRLTEGRIQGSPTEVRRFTESRFVIRAEAIDIDGTLLDLEDRTFSISVDGADIPEWITKEGFLNVGPGEAFFVLDNSSVNFQLEVYDTDVIAGDNLEFYLTPLGGELPPGLSLSRDGVISGFTDPVFALEYTEFPTGGYDVAPYSVTPLDFVEARTNGFDDYFYDNVTYDYSENSRIPRRLSRIYNFVVSVTDGINTVNRLFKIFVVTEEFLSADNSIVQVDTNLFQAGATGDRKPLWITESNLGRFRANNYITLFLDVYDPPTLSGTITYFLLPTNYGIYQLNSTGEIIYNGEYEITGKFPNFSYVSQGDWEGSKTYKIGDLVLYNTFQDSTNRFSAWVCLIANTNQRPAEDSIYWTTDIVSNSQRFTATDPSQWTVIEPETVSQIPPGLVLDSITGELAGKVSYQAAVTKSYKFTMMAVNYPANLSTDTYNLKGDWNAFILYQERDAVRYDGFIWIALQSNTNQLPEEGGDYWYRGVSTAAKTFTVDVFGEIESSIEWITPSDRGSIKPNQPSKLYVEAAALIYGGRISYEFVSGSLPPGLTFLPTGLIEGKVRQFADSDNAGLSRVYDKILEISDLTGTFIVGDIITGSVSGAVGKIIRRDLAAGKLYYDLGYIDPLTQEFRGSASVSNFVNNETISATSNTAIIELVSREFTLSFDNNITSIDKKFTFTIKARDSANVAESLRTFTITVIADNTKTFANLYVKSFQSKEKRLAWYDFITDVTVFAPVDIYRYGDPNFGIQTDLKMLTYAGIESVEAVKYVQSMSRNHYRKRLLFGDVKVAKGKDLITQETIYEVIYVEIIDDLEKNGRSVSREIQLASNIKSKVLVSYDAIKVDSDIPFASDRDHQRVFPNSIKNMRKRIQSVGERDREFLPLWMRSIQDDAASEPGFVKALVLCYAKPGRSANILARINRRLASKELDFKLFDFTADRYLIDILDGEIQDKYLAFPQRGEKLP